MVKKWKNTLAILLAVMMVVAMLPAVTQEASAAVTEVDFIKYVSGLHKGNIVPGTTLSLNVDDVIASNEEMMQAFLISGYADVYLKTYSPSDTLLFDYDSSSGKASLKVNAGDADIGSAVNIMFQIGGDTFFCPAINVVDRSANTLSVKGKTAKLSYKKLKKKAQTLAVSKVISFLNKGQGPKTYSLYSAKKGKKSFKKYFKVNASTGAVTVRKKLKKGTYTLKIKVKAKGTVYYKPSAQKTVTVKIKVK